MMFLTKFFTRGFLSSPLGKLFLGLVVAVTIWVGFTLWLSNRDSNIREITLLEFNQQQLLLLEQQRRIYEERIVEVEQSQATRIAAITAERDAATTEAENLIKDIRSGKFDGDEEPSSAILREAIKQLQQRANGG